MDNVAQNPDPNQTETRTLPVKLTAAEVRAHERTIPQLLAQIDAKTSEAATAAAGHKATIKALAKDVATRKEAAISGFEQRPVACFWRVRGDRRELVREDTREVVETHGLSAREIVDRRQRKLFEPTEAIQTEEVLTQLVAFVASFAGEKVAVGQVAEAFPEYREEALTVTLDKLAEAGRLVRLVDGWRTEVPPASKGEPKPAEGKEGAAQ